MFEIIAKAAGEGMTAQVVIGPFNGEPPAPLLQAVRESLGEKFYDWTGSHPATVVVRSSTVVA